MVHYCKKIVCELICFTSSRKITFLTLSIISGVLALPLIAIASFGQIDALGPWHHGELECNLDYQILYACHYKLLLIG